MSTQITFIGFGEAANHLSRGISSQNAVSVQTYDRLFDSDTSRMESIERATRANVKTFDDAPSAVEGSAYVFSTVTADQCVVAADEASPGLSENQFWLDLNSTSPMQKLAAAKIVNEHGARYVDVAVMENVPAKGHRVPLLLAGEAANACSQALKKLGMDATVVGDTVGQAATIKMCRSIFLKGFDAILLETLSAASVAGVHDDVLKSIDASFPQLGLPDAAKGRLKRVSQHAKRRASEMQAVCDTLDFLKLTPRTATATQAVLTQLSSSGATELASADDCDVESLLLRYTAKQG